MEKNIHTNEQITEFIREHEKGELTIVEFCHLKSINETTFYTAVGKSVLDKCKWLRSNAFEGWRQKTRLKCLSADHLIEFGLSSKYNGKT